MIVELYDEEVSPISIYVLRLAHCCSVKPEGHLIPNLDCRFL